MRTYPIISRMCSVARNDVPSGGGEEKRWLVGLPEQFELIFFLTGCSVQLFSPKKTGKLIKGHGALTAFPNWGTSQQCYIQVSVWKTQNCITVIFKIHCKNRQVHNQSTHMNINRIGFPVCLFVGSFSLSFPLNIASLSLSLSLAHSLISNITFRQQSWPTRRYNSDHGRVLPFSPPDLVSNSLKIYKRLCSAQNEK